MSSSSQAASSLVYREGDQPVPGYTLVRELGRGAMGVVWLAKTESGFERALKIINLQQRGGKKEYRGLRTIKQRKLLHGNLLTLIDYWLKDEEGRFVPDSDELDSTDSFFASVKAGEAQPSTMAATTPQSVQTTSAGTNPSARGGASSGTAAPPAADRRAVTRVGATLVNMVSQTPDGGLDRTADQGEFQSSSGPRPVQLIVAMELGHKTLDDRQKQCQEDRLPGVPAEELLAYMEQAARGLDYLHREGIVHRDIKPQNIMLVGDVAKVCDYGLVVSTDADLRATSNAFTPLYASPEAVGEKPVNGQSDQYSLAVTYVELRTGHTPYNSETAASVYAAKETGKYNLSRIKNKAVRNVLKRALARSPNERFASCSAFIRELEIAELNKSAMVWLIAAAAAVFVIGVGAALAVPELRQRLLSPDSSGDGGIVVSPERQRGADARKTADEEPPQPPLPPPAPEMRKVVDEARALRLAGSFDEAEAKLNELKIDADSTDLANWAYQLERLHLEVSRQIDAATAVSASQWDAWRLAADRLFQRSRGQGADQAELAALKVFVATRLDAAQLSLTQPVADDLARAISGRQHWSKVLAKPEQVRLETIQKAFGERIVAAVEPLPPAWKKRLAEIWPGESAAKLLIERVQQCIRQSNTEGLTIAANDLEDVASQSSFDAIAAVKPQLAQVRLEIKQAENRLLADSLARNLTSDDFLIDSEVRKRLLDRLRSLGDSTDLPLARLLRIEAELAEHDFGDKKYASETLDELREQIARLRSSSEPSSKEWLAYAGFLLARVEINLQRAGSRGASAISQVDVLTAWPEGETADWHTRRRKEQAIDMLVRLGDAALPLSEKDAVRFHDLPRDWTAQAATAVTYLEKAQRLGDSSPDVAGLLALAMSVSARQADATEAWTKIAQYADQALASWGGVSDLTRQNRLPAVQYVGALAASRLRDPATQPRNRQAIITLATLLKQSFRDDALKNTNVDRGVLENIVLPGLSLPLEAGDAPAAELAALSAAKGRLIERNPSFASMSGVNPVQHDDDYARAILTSHEAYANALKLHDDIVAAAGSARTILKLPRELFDWQKYERELTDLVQRHAQAALSEPSLLFADACVLRRRALLAPQRAERLKLAEQAIDRFAKLDSATRDADPYAIRGVALCYASDIFLKAAFWTPIQASDETKAASDSHTKFYFLRQALDCASAAQADINLLLPEEARIAKGNALEDMALYYKETDNYQAAAAAFQDGVDQIGRRRSKAYALMSLGRCQYRWAIDASRIDGDPEARAKHLREAYQSLTDAVAHARASDPGVAPEASFWLATTMWEGALEGPGNLDAPADGAARGFRTLPVSRLRSGLEDPSRKAEAAKELAERFGLMERARQDIIKAANEARAHSPLDWALFMPTAAFLGKKLADDLTAVKTAVATNLAPAAIVDDVHKEVQELLALAEKQPAALSARERRSLVDLLVRIQVASDPSPQKAAAQLYQSYERLFADENDDARAQLVLLKLVRGNASVPPDFSEAEQVAARITSPALAEWSRGYCDKFKADALLRPYRDKIKSYLRDPSMSKSLTLADDARLLAIQEAYASALHRLSQAADAKTAENLKSMLAAPLEEIENAKWQANLTSLQSDLLRQNIEETEKLVRGQLYELLDARIYLHRTDWPLKDLKKPLPESGRAALRQMVECLKPLRFIEVRFSEEKMDDYTRDYLRTCEARLK